MNILLPCIVPAPGLRFLNSCVCDALPLPLNQVILVSKPVRLPLSTRILQFPVAIQLLVGVRITEFIVPTDNKPPILV